jgi:hypothetical protein
MDSKKNNHEFSHSVALSPFQFQITALYFLYLFSIVLLYSYWECTSQNNTTGELGHYLTLFITAEHWNINAFLQPAAF